MNTILLSLLVMLSQLTVDYPCPQMSMKCYPERFMPGDPLYILLEAKNLHEKSIHISNNFSPIYRDIQLCLTDTENQTVPLLFEASTSSIPRRVTTTAEIKPGETRIIGALAINVPALEDIRDPFWEKHLKTIPPEGKAFQLEAIFYFRPYASSFHPFGTDELHPMQVVSLEQTIFLMPRTQTEMAMFEEWLDNTPVRLLPIPHVWSLIGFPLPSWGDAERKVHEFPMNKFPRDENAPPRPDLIRVGNEEYSQWFFIRRGNRYPAYPNAPETWQGWKELEESITPSTMRDEIRLTRIFIQYCDTRDEKVLEELREWFAEVNEIQRTHFVSRIASNALHNSRPDTFDLFDAFRDLYFAIREYDTADNSERVTELMKERG